MRRDGTKPGASQGNKFQLTRLREARLDTSVHWIPLSLFQLTRLREARPELALLTSCIDGFQLTRLREARRDQDNRPCRRTGFN